MCQNKRRAGATWCGRCYENLRGRANHPGHLHCRRKRTSDGDGSRMGLRKPVSNGGYPVGSAGDAPSDAAIMFPALFEMLTATAWEDGSPRTTSSLLLFFEDGWFKACVNDRAAGRTGWATGRSADAALASLEASIANDSVEWRKSQQAKNRR